ncbi:succinylglutamate desuccinylase/aspartoacylase domain-containing protein [Fluviispira multicolorata]|nr:succinylglutamate desuccinylase/aspartoacylase family protein [Fluviispira multicolorata]
MLQNYLNKFESFAKKYPGPIEDSISLHFGQHKYHIVFGCLIHGDETGSLPAILMAIEKLMTSCIKYGGIVTFILGNKQAALKEKRYLEADLNRSFSPKEIPNENSFERKRAIEISGVLKNADVFLDFHQTKLHCKEAFYIFEMHEKSYLWARSIGVAKLFVTRKKGEPYTPNGMCSDEYMHLQNKVGITLELGEKGFHKSACKICLMTIEKSLWRMDQIYLFKKNIINIARKSPKLIFLERKYTEPFSSPKKILKDGFFNLQKIKKEQILGYDESGTPLISPHQGYILFPQYPKRNEFGISIEENDAYIYSIVCEIENPKLFIS